MPVLGIEKQLQHGVQIVCRGLKHKGTGCLHGIRNGESAQGLLKAQLVAGGAQQQGDVTALWSARPLFCRNEIGVGLQHLIDQGSNGEGFGLRIAGFLLILIRGCLVRLDQNRTFALDTFGCTPIPESGEISFVRFSVVLHHRREQCVEPLDQGRLASIVGIELDVAAAYRCKFRTQTLEHAHIRSAEAIDRLLLIPDEKELVRL